MSNDLRIAMFIVAFILYFIIFLIFRNGRIPLKFALIWLLPITVVLLVGIVPDFLNFFTNIIGFQTTSNMVIGLLFLILIFICIALTIIVSGQNTKIILLIQEISILKKRMKEEDDE